MSGFQNSSLDEWLKAMPGLDTIPFNVDPQHLYSVRQLYKGYEPEHLLSWKRSLDNTIYEWFVGPAKKNNHLTRFAALSARLHDTAIERGIATFLNGRKGVGFMGGHGIDRTNATFRNVALMARELRRLDFMVISGGGPGLMEAANFGAFMAPHDDKQFDDALQILCSAPKFDDKELWIGTAAQVRASLLGKWDQDEPQSGWSLGVPTWVYGFEPPNLFSSHIAKYFYNSLREDGLVTIANAGLIFGKGDAGTVQEVFQDATLNYYREEGVAATPMILYDSGFWNPSPLREWFEGHLHDPKYKPVFPLLKKLANDAKHPFDTAVLLSDSPEEIVRFVVASNSPKMARPPRLADLKLLLPQN